VKRPIEIPPGLPCAAIEVLDRAGKVYYRLENWEPRRFPRPPRFLRLRIDPRGTYLSTPWNCRVEGLSQEILESYRMPPGGL
jgi:hypothetical protein